jgi:hypothetical protein
VKQDVGIRAQMGRMGNQSRWLCKGTEYDFAHAPADQSNRRSKPESYAVWEIHPVMALQVQE